MPMNGTSIFEPGLVRGAGQLVLVAGPGARGAVHPGRTGSPPRASSIPLGDVLAGSGRCTRSTPARRARWSGTDDASKPSSSPAATNAARLSASCHTSISVTSRLVLVADLVEPLAQLLALGALAAVVERDLHRVVAGLRPRRGPAALGGPRDGARGASTRRMPSTPRSAEERAARGHAPGGRTSVTRDLSTAGGTGRAVTLSAVDDTAGFYVPRGRVVRSVPMASSPLSSRRGRSRTRRSCRRPPGRRRPTGWTSPRRSPCHGRTAPPARGGGRRAAPARCRSRRPARRRRRPWNCRLIARPAAPCSTALARSSLVRSSTTWLAIPVTPRRRRSAPPSAGRRRPTAAPGTGRAEASRLAVSFGPTRRRARPVGVRRAGSPLIPTPFVDHVRDDRPPSLPRSCLDGASGPGEVTRTAHFTRPDPSGHGSSARRAGSGLTAGAAPAPDARRRRPAPTENQSAARSGTTTSASMPGVVVVTATVAAPAARAAAMPDVASSTTRHAAGSTPRRAAATVKGSGSGLPRCTSSAVTTTAGTGRPDAASLARASAPLADVTTAHRPPGARAPSASAAPGRAVTPATSAISSAVMRASARCRSAADRSGMSRSSSRLRRDPVEVAEPLGGDRELHPRADARHGRPTRGRRSACRPCRTGPRRRGGRGRPSRQPRTGRWRVPGNVPPPCTR